MGSINECPVCKIPITWKETENPNVFRGICSKCGMGFTKLKKGDAESVMSDPKYSRQ